MNINKDLLEAEIARLENIIAIQQKQIERLMEARDAEKLKCAALLAACKEALNEAAERDEDLGMNCWPQVRAAIDRAEGK